MVKKKKKQFFAIQNIMIYLHKQKGDRWRQTWINFIELIKGIKNSPTIDDTSSGRRIFVQIF